MYKSRQQLLLCRYSQICVDRRQLFISCERCQWPRLAGDNCSFSVGVVEDTAWQGTVWERVTFPVSLSLSWDRQNREEECKYCSVWLGGKRPARGGFGWAGTCRCYFKFSVSALVWQWLFQHAVSPDCLVPRECNDVKRDYIKPHRRAWGGGGGYKECSLLACEIDGLTASEVPKWNYIELRGGERWREWWWYKTFTWTEVTRIVSKYYGVARWTTLKICDISMLLLLEIPTVVRAWTGEGADWTIHH